MKDERMIRKIPSSAHGVHEQLHVLENLCAKKMFSCARFCRACRAVFAGKPHIHDELVEEGIESSVVCSWEHVRISRPNNIWIPLKCGNHLRETGVFIWILGSWKLEKFFDGGGRNRKTCPGT